MNDKWNKIKWVKGKNKLHIEVCNVTFILSAPDYSKISHTMPEVYLSGGK